MSSISNEEKNLLKNEKGQILSGYAIKLVSAHNGNETVEYLGRDFTVMGEYGFMPYKSIKGAESGIAAWKNRFNIIENNDNNIRQKYSVEPVTASLYKEVEIIRENTMKKLSQCISKALPLKDYKDEDLER